MTSLQFLCRTGGWSHHSRKEPEEAAASREALLRYCELDTWAMVKVWEKLKEMAG